MISANRIVSGKRAEILAYGFSGKSPYHFSSRYLIPCAISIENGSIKNTIASGLKPVIIIQKTNRMEAMELRDAKKPLVVDNRPIITSAKFGKLISGERKTFSVVLCHENNGARPIEILPKKCETSKSRENNKAIMVSGWWIILIPSIIKPLRIIMMTMISGSLGRFLTMNLR